MMLCILLTLHMVQVYNLIATVSQACDLLFSVMNSDSRRRLYIQGNRRSHPAHNSESHAGRHRHRHIERPCFAAYLRAAGRRLAALGSSYVALQTDTLSATEDRCYI